MELNYLSIEELGQLIRTKKVSPGEVAQAFSDRIALRNPQINAFISMVPEQFTAAVREAETAIQRGELWGPLHGIPLALKDLFAMKDTRTTGGSALFADNVTPADSAVVERLRAAGACIIGKTNMHELAYGTTNINAFYGPVRNPWQLEHHPGGSSGGSAAAVADGQAPAALGSDTGASIRLPAAFCGLVGLKPTYGQISRFGMLPCSWSHDHAGALTRTVRDAALMFQALAGADSRDASTTPTAGPAVLARIEDGVAGLRIGVLNDCLDDACAPDIRAAVEAAIQTLQAEGAEIKDQPWADLKAYGAISFVIVASEVGAKYGPYLARNPEGVSDEIARMLRLGTLFSAEHYLKAQRIRSVAIAKARDVFDNADVLVLPTSPEHPGKIAEITSSLSHSHDYTIPFNFLGLPAISLPCGFSAAGLPIGLQIVGPAFREDLVLRVARAYERAMPWSRRRPNA